MPSLAAVVALIVAIQTIHAGYSDSERPHIIFIYADDMGWNDVSYHGSPEIPTPNIDALGLSGIVLHRYYGAWLCTPSRAALMTGKYPTRLGMQNGVVRVGEQSGLPLDEVTLAQYLKSLDYSTHIVGKWHLGYATEEYTPTYRGFDSFYGYYNGAIEYYDYTIKENTSIPENPIFNCIDLQNGTTPITDFRAVYATHQFTEVATEIIDNHDTSKPLFLYLPHLAVHAGSGMANSVEQAPPEDIKKFSYIGDRNRRIHAARVMGLDYAVGVLFESLADNGMLDNSIVVFASDNGGETGGRYNGYSSNYPLRGNKNNLLEGSVRVPAIIWSPLLQLTEPRISTQLMHVTDWLPTLYTAAGGDPSDLVDLDGIDMWSALVNDDPSPRTELFHNTNPIAGMSAYLDGDMKLINGSDENNGWYGPTGFEYVSVPESMEEWVFKEGSTVRDIVTDMDMWTADDADQWYAALQVQCVQPPPEESTECDVTVSPCLFNVTADPCEYYDLADEYPEVVESLQAKIQEFGDAAKQPQSKPSDPKADPICYDFTCVPFVGTVNYETCNVT